MPNQYRGSQAQATIVVLRTYSTTTTIGAYGSEDGFVTPRTEFADDEEIMVAGTVGVTNNADLTGVAMTILVDGFVVGTTLLYGYDGAINYYQASLGRLPEGTHVVEARFPRTRK
jgi:hypothetical protein